MIIGGNNNFHQTNFNKNLKYNLKKDNTQQKELEEKKDFGFKENMNTYKYTNPTDEIAMYDKSIAILHERLNNKTISLEEFNKQCEKIGKKKKDALKNKNNY